MSVWEGTIYLLQPLAICCSSIHVRIRVNFSKRNLTCTKNKSNETITVSITHLQMSNRRHYCSFLFLYELKTPVHLRVSSFLLPFWSTGLQWVQVPTLPGGSRRRPPWTSPGRCLEKQVQPADGRWAGSQFIYDKWSAPCAQSIML